MFDPILFCDLNQNIFRWKIVLGNKGLWTQCAGHDRSVDIMGQNLLTLISQADIMVWNSLACSVFDTRARVPELTMPIPGSGAAA